MMLTGAAARVPIAGKIVTKHKGIVFPESDDSAYITEPTETDQEY